jgi:hypothetical protein
LGGDGCAFTNTRLSRSAIEVTAAIVKAKIITTVIGTDINND